jgi:hypothetical protein
VRKQCICSRKEQMEMEGFQWLVEGTLPMKNSWKSLNIDMQTLKKEREK